MAELTSQPTSIQSVYGWYSERRLFVNRRYQRKLVWTLEEKQKLVESILRKFPIPAILMAEKEDTSGAYEIIDGLQRLNAIVSFIEESFPMVDGRYFAITDFPTAKARWDAKEFAPASQVQVLLNKEVTTILDYTLAFSVMREASDDEVDDVFDRINSYGHRLSDQERRQSGIQNQFSDMVREIACKIRGDESSAVIALSKMPEISIDLPMMKHGYDVKAEDVFWCKQGVLRATDVRDSMDEQCIADIAGSIISGTILERSKDALDNVYAKDSPEATQLLGALKVYGKDKFSDEFYYCIDQITSTCEIETPEKLRNLLFEERNTNAFPAVFAQLFIAFHELFVKEKKSISDFGSLKGTLNNIARRIDTSRRATSSDERRKNVDIIKALITQHFVDSDPAQSIYSDHSSIDVDSFIRRSAIELANFELKQGILSLNKDRKVNIDILDKIVMTICAIANNGPNRAGQILIGVADKPEDVKRIKDFDKVQPREVAGRYIVGINREALAIGCTLEKYHGLIRAHISNAALSEPLKSSVLSSIDFNSYFGLGVIIISVPPQREPSYYRGQVYWRDGDNTRLASEPKLIADIGRRF